MTVANTVALLEMYRHKGVGAVTTPSGVVFMGMRSISKKQRELLLAISQSDLKAALRWQK